MSYATEFPTFGPLPAQVADLLAKGSLADISWHYDACPSFIRSTDLEQMRVEGSTDRLPVLWVDFADPAEREDSNTHRFLVVPPSFAGETLATDNEGEAIAKLLAFPSDDDERSNGPRHI